MQQILALIITIVIEFIIIWVLLRIKPGQALAYSVLINSLTLPLATYIYQSIVSNFVLVEVGIFLVESFSLAQLLARRYWKVIWVTFIANLTTSILSLLFI